MKWLNPSIVQNEQRRSFYLIIVGIWIIIAIYAILHDQYLVRIAPEHFTIYHPNPLCITSAPLLALYVAFKASVSPGLVLAAFSWFAGRSGTRPKLSLPQMFMAVLVIVAITESIAALSGVIVFFTQKPLYPMFVYPELTVPLMTTQTIQLTCYLAAIASSIIMLKWMIEKRRRMAESQTDSENEYLDANQRLQPTRNPGSAHRNNRSR